MKEHKALLEKDGHEVRMPVFDDPHYKNEYETCDQNRINILWADLIHIIWDARSIGTVFDVGMCFALQKPIKTIFINDKVFVNFVHQYEEIFAQKLYDSIALNSDDLINEAPWAQDARDGKMSAIKDVHEALEYMKQVEDLKAAKKKNEQ